MAKFSDPLELPEWFDLNKYSGTSEFTSIEWLRCLDLRRQLLIGHPDFPEKMDLCEGGWAPQLRYWQQKVSPAAEILRESPLRLPPSRGAMIIKGNPPRLASLFFEGGLQHRRPDHADAPIRPVTEFDIRVHSIGNPEARGLEEDFWVDQHRPAIVINMNAKNADIEKAFKLWLKAERAKKAIKQPFYSRWAEDQILPYLDLTIWAMEVDAKISDPQMGDTLFPEDAAEGGNERLKGTKAKAKRALLDLPALRAAALKEGEV